MTKFDRILSLLKNVAARPEGAMIDHAEASEKFMAAEETLRRILEEDASGDVAGWYAREREAEKLAGEMIIVAVSACCPGTLVDAMAISCAAKALAATCRDDREGHALWAWRATHFLEIASMARPLDDDPSAASPLKVEMFVLGPNGLERPGQPGVSVNIGDAIESLMKHPEQDQAASLTDEHVTLLEKLSEDELNARAVAAAKGWCHKCACKLESPGEGRLGCEGCNWSIEVPTTEYAKH